MTSRRNGFDRPLSKLQLMSWAAISTNVMTAILITVLKREEPIVLMFFVIYLLSLMIMLILGYSVTSGDPSFTKKCLTVNRSKEEDDYFCKDCDISVEKTTIHCLYCNKCIEKFDHHCKIINNCIGKKNYKLFFCLVVSAQVQQFIFISFLLAVLSTLTFESENIFLLSLDAIVLLPNCCILIYNTYILVFHVVLACKQMTTVEYIKLKKAERIKPSLEAETE